MSEIITNVPTYTLNTGAVMPAVGLGTFGSDKYLPEQIATAVSGAVRIGYRMLDCASVYQNEDRIGEILSRLFKNGIVKREELFITSKVWNDQHREVRKACLQSLKDLKLEYIDLYFVHWPFPNYHAPGCDGDSRNPDSKPFSVDEFIDTWKQLEELFDYACSHDMVPIGFCSIGSPSRPERDRCSTDVADTELKEVVSVAGSQGIHPALVYIKWAVQRGMCTIPFSVKEAQYISNLKCTTVDPLTEEEMELLKDAERNCRLVKGQVFLWPGADDWTQLWE